jgi:hypothetical protein
MTPVVQSYSAYGREAHGSAGVEIKPVLNHIGRYRVSKDSRGIAVPAIASAMAEQIQNFKR